MPFVILDLKPPDITGANVTMKRVGLDEEISVEQNCSLKRIPSFLHGAYFFEANLEKSRIKRSTTGDKSDSNNSEKSKENDVVAKSTASVEENSSKNDKEKINKDQKPQSIKIRGPSVIYLMIRKF